MTKHLAEKDTIAAESKAKTSWCSAEDARTAVVAAMQKDCEDATIGGHKATAVKHEAEGREQTSYGWSAAARPNLPNPNPCGSCQVAPCNCRKEYKNWAANANEEAANLA